MKTLELEKNIFEPFHWSIIFSVASSCVWRLFLFATFDIGIDVFAGLESLFKTNHEVNTINNHLDQWEFRETKTISVGNIEHTTFGGCVDTTLKICHFRAIGGFEELIIRGIEFSSYRRDRFKFSETHRFLSFGVWVCRGDCRILGGRKVFRVSCGHQRGHQFLNFRLLFRFGNFPTLDFRSNMGYLFHDSVPSFPKWKTELKIMKMMCPSKLIHQKK